MYMSTQNGYSLATSLIETKSRKTKMTWRWWQAMTLHPIPFPCALTLPLTTYRDTTTPSPCWTLHFMTQERLVVSNSTPNELRLPPAATMSNNMLSALILPYLKRCKTSSVGQSAGLSIPRSSVRFRQKIKNPRTQIYMDLRYINPQARVLNHCFK